MLGNAHKTWMRSVQSCFFLLTTHQQIDQMEPPSTSVSARGRGRGRGRGAAAKAADKYPVAFTEQRERSQKVILERMSEAYHGQPWKNRAMRRAFRKSYFMGLRCAGVLPLIETRMDYGRWDQSVDGSVGHMIHKPASREDEVSVPKDYVTPPINWHRAIRAHVFAEVYDDVDIVNCHFVLTQSLCRRLGIPCATVDDYIANRELHLQEIQLHLDNKIDRDTAKMLFLRILYGGSWYGLMQELTQPRLSSVGFELPPLMTLTREEKREPYVCSRLYQGMTRIFESFRYIYMSEYTTILEQRYDKFFFNFSEDHKSPKDRKLQSKVFSIYVQTQERKIIDACMDHCRALGYDVGPYMYDGFMVEKGKATHEVLDQLARIASSQGYGVTFEVKQMNLTQEWLGLPKEIDDEDSDCEDHDDEMFSMRCYEDPSSTTAQRTEALLTLASRMHLRKADKGTVQKEFEYAHVKICKGGMYAVIHPDGEIEVVPPKKLLQMYSHLQYRTEEENARGKLREVVRPFIPAWMSSPDIRLYYKIDFAPPPIKVDHGTFNTFYGFPIERLVPGVCNLDAPSEKQKRCLELWNLHLLVLASHNQDHADYLEARFADIFQFPGRKCPRALVLRGAMGSGKNILFKLLKNLLGHYYRQMQSMDRLLGRFSNAFVDTLLLLLDEAEFRDSVKFIEAFKDAVTEETRNYEKKGVDEVVVRNLARIFITTNNLNCLPIPPGNRRVEVLQVASDMIEDEAYFTEMATLFDDQDCQRFMFDHLRSVDISKYCFTNKKTLLVTDALKEMMGHNFPLHAKFAGELCWFLRSSIIQAQGGKTKGWVHEPHAKLVKPGVIRVTSSFLHHTFHDSDYMKLLHLKPPRDMQSTTMFGSLFKEVDGVSHSSMGKACLKSYDLDIRQIWAYCNCNGYSVGADGFKFPHEDGYLENQESLD